MWRKDKFHEFHDLYDVMGKCLGSNREIGIFAIELFIGNMHLSNHLHNWIDFVMVRLMLQQYYASHCHWYSVNSVYLRGQQVCIK